MQREEAERYHARPDRAPSPDAGADMVAAYTLTYAEEAVGIVARRGRRTRCRS